MQQAVAVLKGLTQGKKGRDYDNNTAVKFVFTDWSKVQQNN